MLHRLSVRVLASFGSLAMLSFGAVGAVPAAAPPVLQLVPLSFEAPESPGINANGGAACTTPAPLHTYAWYHCYTPADVRAAYDVGVGNPSTGTGNLGQGQTIVLVDSYGSPTAANDIKFFHDAFYPNLPDPNFDEVYPQGAPDYTNGCGPNGFSAGPSGPCAAAGWSEEATLDIEWSYAIAPLAHIVLLAVPPAETEGVQGFPNLFDAIRGAINSYPAGTIFSQSFGVTEQSFGSNGSAALTQVSSFDQVYKAGNAKGDTFFASSGDYGTDGFLGPTGSKTYPGPTVGWPASSPYVTAVGGTQLQYGWTWNPTSDVPFDSNGLPTSAYFSYQNGGNSEAVWNESWLPAATGGGPSVLYSRPAWQMESVSGAQRGVPDLAWNAAVNGGVLIYISAFPGAIRTGWHVIGGTSAGSPQMAGVAALVNEARSAAGKAPIGFLGTHIYNLPANDYVDIVPETYGTASTGSLHDNTLWAYQSDGSVAPGGIHGWETLTGYDMTTGLGRPDVAKFVSALS